MHPDRYNYLTTDPDATLTDAELQQGWHFCEECGGVLRQYEEVGRGCRCQRPPKPPLASRVVAVAGYLFLAAGYLFLASVLMAWAGFDFLHGDGDWTRYAMAATKAVLAFMAAAIAISCALEADD